MTLICLPGEWPSDPWRAESWDRRLRASSPIRSALSNTEIDSGSNGKARKASHQVNNGSGIVMLIIHCAWASVVQW